MFMVAAVEAIGEDTAFAVTFLEGLIGGAAAFGDGWELRRKGRDDGALGGRGRGRRRGL